MLTRSTVAAGILITALAASPVAEAKKTWVAGSIERSTVVNCPSRIGGFPYLETGAVANAEAFVDSHRLPRVGHTFYVRTEPGAIGHPCANQAVAVEIVLPRGVKLAITRKTPIRCAYWDIDTRKVTKVKRSGGCPKKAKHGIYGLALNRGAGKGPTWELPYGQALRIEVPVRSKRRLKGAAGGPITCARNEGDPPCSPQQAGDHLQFANHVFDGNDNPWLSPNVPLFVRPRKH
jgi:hypothetical protein